MDPTSSPHDRYLNRLKEIPPPGSGVCHVSLLGIANTGLRAGIPPEQIRDDLLRHLKPGTRNVTEGEIDDAVRKAASDFKHPVTLSTGELYHRYVPRRPKPAIVNRDAVMSGIISQASVTTEEDLWEDSPIRITGDPGDDAALFLAVMFDPEDLLWVGDRVEPGIPGQNIRKASQWIEYFQAGGGTAPFIIVNPLTGKPAQSKAGDETYRGDGNVARYRYCLGEFDNMSREDQLRFWAGVRLPIRALVDTGGKSIHAWIDVQALGDIKIPGDWTREIRGELYARGLIPLGIDSSCSNPSRLSRLPGHYRSEKDKYQRLLWLSSGGDADE